MPAAALLARLNGVKPRGPQRWVARCPAHKDRTPSLSIAELADGRVLINDFGGCSAESVLDALGLTLSDLYPAPLGHEFARVPRERSHLHAAADALKVIAHEALVVAIAAEDMAAGMSLTPSEREQLLECAGVIRAAADVV